MSDLFLFHNCVDLISMRIHDISKEKDSCGVYLIEFDTPNGIKRYVGSSAKRFKYRWSKHINECRKGSHHNPQFQRNYEKYGSESMRFSILELVSDIDCLYEVEQKWIDYFKGRTDPDYFLNVASVAGSCLGVKRSPETCKKISDALAGKPFSEAHKQALRGQRKERVPKLPPKDRRKAYVGFVSPDGDVYRNVHGLLSFCREHNLRPQEMSRVASGRSVHCHGWRSLGAGGEVPAHLYPALVSPDGIVYANIFNLTEFCRQHGLTVPNMSSVIAGRYQQHKGWRLQEPHPPRYRYPVLISPSGELFSEITNLLEFAHIHGLQDTNLRKVISGKRRHHRGWRIHESTPSQVALV